MSCPEYSPDDLKEWVETDDVPELAKTAHLEFVDIDSGHWPRSPSRRLAELILDEAKR